MPRQPRLVIKGVPQHIIVRGNNREPIFAEQSDYHFYRDKLKEASDKHGLDIHAYVLMTNHVHILATPEHKSSMAKVMQIVGRYYVQYFNYKYQRSGTLWEGRYKSCLLDSEHYFLVCSRYIELNPVRANMVNQPEEYPWSSYHCNASGVNDLLITPSETHLALGSNHRLRQKAYCALFRSHIDNDVLERIRITSNQG